MSIRISGFLMSAISSFRRQAVFLQEHLFRHQSAGGERDRQAEGTIALLPAVQVTGSRRRAAGRRARRSRWSFKNEFRLPAVSASGSAPSPSSAPEVFRVSQAERRFGRPRRHRGRHDRELFARCGHCSSRTTWSCCRFRLQGRDYRVVVLDGEVVSAYERVPFSVIGDGDDPTSLCRSQMPLPACGPTSAGPKFGSRRPRIAAELKRQDPSWIPFVGGKTVRLLPNANLSAGGSSVDPPTDRIDRFYQDVAAKVAARLGRHWRASTSLPTTSAPEETIGSWRSIPARALKISSGSSKESEARTRESIPPAAEKDERALIRRRNAQHQQKSCDKPVAGAYS